MLTMLLGGLWHGAAWTFVLWGGLHGIGLAVHRLMLRGRKVGLVPPPSNAREGLRFAVNVLFTFHLVCLAWVFFRADGIGSAWEYLGGIVTGDWTLGTVTGLGDPVPKGLFLLAFYGLLTLLVDVPCWLGDHEVPFRPSWPVAVRGLAYAAILILISFVGVADEVPFIYFQF
jgi:hypothetical protein